MKKLLIILIVFTSCETTIKRTITEDKFEGGDIQIITIDSCEYIYFPCGSGTWASHKGNCKFCQERLYPKTKNR